MPFADVFSGFEGAASDHFSKLLEMQYGQRRDAGAFIAKMADDPRFDEASSMALKHRALDIIGGDPMKPLSSKDIDISQILVRPPAPPPVKVPGGQGPQNMPIGQQLSGPAGQANGPQQPPSLAAIQGGVVPPISMPQAPSQAPAPPQAPPNTGPTGQLADKTLQAPTPPPHPLGMLPFPEQTERERQRSMASTGIIKQTLWQTDPGQTLTRVMPDGMSHKIDVQKRLNPDTGQTEQRQIDLGPITYAPRAAVGADISAADAARLQQAGIPDTLNSPSLEQEQAIAQMGMRLVHTGYGTFYVASQKYRPENIAGQITAVPQTPTSGQPMAGAVNMGQATSTLPRTTQGTQTVPLPGGRLGVTGTQRTTTTQLPGAAQAPTPPPGGGTSLTQGPTPEAVQLLMEGNKSWGMTKEQATKILQEMQQGTGPVPAPAAPPPTSPQANAPRVGEAREIAGAGRRLSAEQIKENSTRAGVLGTTIGRGANVLNTFDQIVGSPQKLDSFLKRAQLAIVANPASPTKFSLLVQNQSNLSPAEAQFAADYASLGEDINVMRAITNATGFRGREAFEVLQGQRGALLGNPEVFKRTLQNSLRTIITQLGPLKRVLEDSNYHVQDTKDIINGYRAVFTNPKELETALRNDGWIQ